jgi:hypothetical protein
MMLSQIELERPFAEPITIRSQTRDLSDHNRPADPFHVDLLKTKKPRLRRGFGSKTKKASLTAGSCRYGLPAVMRNELLRPIARRGATGDENAGDHQRHGGVPCASGP